MLRVARRLVLLTAVVIAAPSCGGDDSSGVDGGVNPDGGGGNDGGGNDGGGNDGGGNDSGGNDGGAACTAAAVVINEIRYDLPGPGDAGNEWVELHNTGDEAVNIGGWSLGWGASGFSNQLTLPEQTSIPAMGYFVIGGEDVGEADLATAELVNLGNASTAPDGVRLVNGADGVVDTVLYGDAGDNTDNWVDDCGPAETWAPEVFSSESLARIPNGVDTNRGTDFQGDNTPTLGGPNQ